jgi:PAS domain-containing protein
VIVVGLVLASEFAIDQIVVQEGDRSGFAVVNALAIAALVGVFVFFLFQGAVEDRERASVALANSEERFRSLTTLSADWFWEADSEHRISWIAGGQSMLKLFGSELAYGRRVWEIPGIDVPEDALAAHLVALQTQRPFHEFELCRPGRAGATEHHRISGEPRFDPEGLFLGERADLRKPDAVIMDDAGYKQIWPGEPYQLGRVFEMNDRRAVIVGLARTRKTFQSFPVVYTRYSQAVRFAPPERKVLSFVLAEPVQGVAAGELAARISAQTGLQALSRAGLPSVARKPPAPSLLESTICAARLPAVTPGSIGVDPVTANTESKSVSADKRRATAWE